MAPKQKKPAAPPLEGPKMSESMDHTKWHCKWDSVPDPADELPKGEEPESVVAQAAQIAYSKEMGEETHVDKLKQMKIRMAMDAYEKRRPKDRVMHHYWVKDAGDPEAVGEYYATGDERNSCPIYRNQKGLILSRETQPKDGDGGDESYGWVIGSMEDRRPLYGCMTDDLSVPTVGWTTFTAPGPMPVIRYYTHGAASRVYKDKGNAAFQQKNYAEAESFYNKALDCKLDPKEFAELLGTVLSNRAEVRLRQGSFEGAALDAERSVNLLRDIYSIEESTEALKQKTVVRWAKALQGLGRYGDGWQLLRDIVTQWPGNPEISKLSEDMALAMRTAPQHSQALMGRPSGSEKGITERMIHFLSTTVEVIQNEVASLGGGLSGLALPGSLMGPLKKLEYLLSKAQATEGDCLPSLQALLRTTGGLRTMLQIINAQWKGNMEGKFVDLFKLPGLTGAVAALTFGCRGCPESLRMAAEDAYAVLAALSGCNRKVEPDVCEGLVLMVSGLWEHCKSKSIDSVQSHSFVVERAAAALARIGLVRPNDDVSSGPDAPAVSNATQEKALALLEDWLAHGGRIEKRAVRGIVQHLVGFDGTGFFTSKQATIRSIGELVLSKAIADPSLLSTREIGSFLKGVRHLVDTYAGSAGKDKVVSVDYKEFGSSMRYVDLAGWEDTSDGKSAGNLLRAVGKALEYRLMEKNRELGRDDFAEAFATGGGWFIVVPLVQAPCALAEPALQCIAAMVQESSDNALHAVGFSTVHTLLGLPSPEVKPVDSCVAQSLQSSVGARRYAAKVLSRTAEAEATMDLLQTSGDHCVKELVKLALQVRKDGPGNLEAFHDMLNVFYIISKSQPGPLCKHVPVDMMNILVDLTNVQVEDVQAFYARRIIKVLRADKGAKKMLKPIISRVEEGWKDEDLLFSVQKGVTPAMKDLE